MRTDHSNKAFTLIELLITVSIIAVLASIALPNYLEAQTRAKVSRAKDDMRTLSIALEAYTTDNKSYPPVPIMLGPRFHRFIPLTSPIQYLTRIPTDPFQSVDANAPGGRWRHGMYEYGGTPIDNPCRWALASDGPDRQDDTEPSVFYPGNAQALFAGQVDGFDFTLYDPTNGTVSRGDIFRASDWTSPN